MLKMVIVVFLLMLLLQLEVVGEDPSSYSFIYSFDCCYSPQIISLEILANTIHVYAKCRNSVSILNIAHVVPISNQSFIIKLDFYRNSRRLLKTI